MVSLRAVVIGTGWAGEGYIAALRAASVEVVALCGRSEAPTQAMAQRLGVSEMRLEWRSALEEFQPDIVVVATPAAPHRDIVECAVSHGCHLICEKPLALSAVDAHAMVMAVRTAGVRHAYGATSRYDPHLELAKKLVDDELIGDPVEIECVWHAGLPNTLPHFWLHRLQAGGGVLLNLLPHFLGQALYLTGGSVKSASGWASTPIGQAPVGPTIHDFRDWAPLSEEELVEAAWADVDADLTTTVLTELAPLAGPAVHTVFHASTMTRGRGTSYLDVHGTNGTLHLLDFPWHTHLQRGLQGEDWIDVPVTVDDTDPVQRGWDRLVADFIEDINGASHSTYPTFQEGLVVNELIDAVRSRSTFTHAIRTEPQ